MPFACAGNDNWSNIEGGSILGWEMVMQLADRSQRLDSLVIQVGGGLFFTGFDRSKVE
jgi:threonine dehydratase